MVVRAGQFLEYYLSYISPDPDAKNNYLHVDTSSCAILSVMLPLLTCKDHHNSIYTIERELGIPQRDSYEEALSFLDDHHVPYFTTDEWDGTLLNMFNEYNERHDYSGLQSKMRRILESIGPQLIIGDGTPRSLSEMCQHIVAIFDGDEEVSAEQAAYRDHEIEHFIFIQDACEKIQRPDLNPDLGLSVFAVDMTFHFQYSCSVNRFYRAVAYDLQEEKFNLFRENAFRDPSDPSPNDEKILKVLRGF